MKHKTTVWYVALKNADGRRRVVEVASQQKNDAERIALCDQWDINDAHSAHWQVLESTAVRNTPRGTC